MKVLITGIAGFVGSRLAEYFKSYSQAIEIIGIDNLSRRGSETNLTLLKSLGCTFIHGDIRVKEDVEVLPKVDWIIDCAADPSVLAGVTSSAAKLIGNNLIGTLTLLEKCAKDNSGFIILSTSRVYSIESLNKIPLKETQDRFEIDAGKTSPIGSSLAGITEEFSTKSPVSLYGATKLSSEIMAEEYAMLYKFPLWINRCGVIAGAGQFGKIDQGIFSFWIYQWLLNKPLSYIGFSGTGKQVRDFLSPQDLAKLILKQMNTPQHKAPKIMNVGGGYKISMSLKELSTYCQERTGIKREVKSFEQDRPFDIQLYITDNTLVNKLWDWKAEKEKFELLDEILDWANKNYYLIEKGF